MNRFFAMAAVLWTLAGVTPPVARAEDHSPVVPRSELTAIRDRLLTYDDRPGVIRALGDVCAMAREYRAAEETRFLCAIVAWDLYLLARGRNALGARGSPDGSETLLNDLVRATGQSSPSELAEYVVREVRALRSPPFIAPARDVVASKSALHGSDQSNAPTSLTGPRTAIALSIRLLDDRASARFLITRAVRTRCAACDAAATTYADETISELRYEFAVAQLASTLQNFESDDALKEFAGALATALNAPHSRIQAKLRTCAAATPVCAQASDVVVTLEGNEVRWILAGELEFDGSSAIPAVETRRYDLAAGNQNALGPVASLCTGLRGRTANEAPSLALVVTSGVTPPGLLRTLRSLHCAHLDDVRIVSAVTASSAVKTDVDLRVPAGPVPRVDVRLGGYFVADRSGPSVDLPRLIDVPNRPYDVPGLTRFLDAQNGARVWVRLRENVSPEAMAQLLGTIGSRPVGFSLD